MSTSVARIEVDISSQRMTVFDAKGRTVSYTISTSRNGAGEVEDSECTPRGRHEIAEKIGAGSAPGSVFIGRRATGEIYSPELAAAEPGRDWILTRILWLSGLEPGYNAGGKRDSKSRYIYIHGTPDDTVLGTPGSRGCIRMHNNDVIELFERVETGTPVIISE